MAQGSDVEIASQLEEISGSIEASVDGLKDDLNDFETSIDRIPSPEPPPKTTLQIQGNAGSEGAWQNYLGYFIDPTARHGLGTEALNKFLQGIGERVDGNLPEYASEDVVVETERQSESGNRPDLIIRSEGRFFVCCELKLYSSEGERQTTRYVNDDQIGQTSKDEFPEEGRHYVYITRTARLDADADEFVNITWTDVMEWFRPLSISDLGRHPARTTAQLNDFLDTIRQDMTQDEHLRTATEKMRLYFNHQDAIQEAQAGLNAVYQHEVETWRRNFVESYTPESWSGEWHTNPNKYGQIYHSEWRQDDSLQIDDADITMHFVHLIRDIESFEEGKLTFQLRWPGSSRYRDRFKELFVSDRFADRLDPILGAHDIDKRADYSRRNPRFTEKVYSVVKSDLPESYYEVLSQAVAEHQELGPAINEILATAIREVEQDS